MYTFDNVKENKSKINEQFRNCKSEIKRTENLKNKREDYVFGVKSCFNTYIKKQIHNYLPHQNIERDVSIKPKLSFNESNYDMNTLKAVYRLKLYDSLYPTINSLYDEQKNLEENLKSVQPIFSAFWFLTRKKKKNEAINSANAIEDYLSKSHDTVISEIEEKLKKIDKENVVHDFSLNKNSYLETLNKLKRAELYIDNDPEKPDFSSIQKIFDKISKANEFVEKEVSLADQYKKNVKKKADILFINEVNECLKDIDVEEIKKYVKRISFSALKTEGINSVFDVLKDSIWELSSIRGISENGARAIKKAAKKIEEETQQVTKIKINQDKQSPEMMNLLSALYSYDTNLKFIQNVNRWNQTYKHKIKKSYEYLKTRQTSLDWIQSDVQTKRRIVDAGNTLLNDETQAYLNEISDPELVKQVEGDPLSNDDLWKYFNQNSAHLYAILDELCPGLFGNDDLFYGLPEELAQEIQNECIFPDGLLVTLRRYQEWGVKYILHQKSVLLGDEMGLGKTIQSIATMVSLKNVGCNWFLVICPAAVIVNWCREIEQHSKLKAIKIHGPGKKAELKHWIKTGGVGVTTYETTKFINSYENFKIDLLVVDEAHYVKNPNAKRTKNVIALGKRTERKLYLTGTPLENKVDEMVQLVDQLNHQVALEISNYTYLSQAEIFRQKVAPVYYRRKREDVLTELPDLIEKDAWCSLKPYEKELYEESILSSDETEKEEKKTRNNYQYIRRVSWQVDDLKQSSKADRLLDIIKQAKEQNRKVIVFSFFLDTIKKIQNYLGSICLQPITGAVNPQIRQDIVDEFNQAPDGTVLLGQITAAGTGLNIQAASVVVITEPQFKPSVENQAISRAYRMGQTRNVLVYRLLCEHTVDEKIREKLLTKQKEFNAFADESVAAKANLEIDDKNFKDIIEEEIKRIKKEKLLEKQKSFNASSDESAPEKENLEIDDKNFKGIVNKEMIQVHQERGIQ